MASDAPIFVVGTGRSGSTLLRLLLSAHPRIHISHEASVYVWDGLFPRAATGDAFLRYYLETFSFRWLQVDAAAVVDALPRPFPRAAVGDLFRVLMRLHADKHGAPRTGDKTPSHGAFLGRIFADFPDARVIQITRDPRGTVQSLTRMPWASGSLVANCVGVETNCKQVRPFLDRALVVRLEELLADPRGQMQRVLEFVGEPWDDAVLDHPHHLPASLDMPPLPWLMSSTRPLGQPTESWRDLPPLQLRLIERLCKETMATFGYHPATVSDEPSGLRVLGAALAGIPGAVRFAIDYIRLGLHSRTPEGLGDARSRALFRKLNPTAWSLYPADFELPPPPPVRIPAVLGGGT